MSLQIIVGTDRARWDSFVAEVGGSVLQSWPWGEFKRRQGWRALRLLAVEGCEPLASMQVLARVVPAAGAFLYAPEGPVVSSGAWSDGRAAAPLAALLAAARRRGVALGALALRLDPLTGEVGAPAALAALGLRRSPSVVQPAATAVLDLDRTEDELWRGLARDARYRVGRAWREGVALRAGTDGDVDTFAAMLAETGRRRGFGVRDAAYLCRLVGMLRAHDCGAFLVATRGGRRSARRSSPPSAGGRRHSTRPATPRGGRWGAAPAALGGAAARQALRMPGVRLPRRARGGRPRRPLGGPDVLQGEVRDAARGVGGGLGRRVSPAGLSRLPAGSGGAAPPTSAAADMEATPCMTHGARGYSRRAITMATPGDEAGLLTVEEAAALLGLTPKTIRIYISTGRLAAVRVPWGRRVYLRIARAEVERYRAEALGGHGWDARRRQGQLAAEEMPAAGEGMDETR